MIEGKNEVERELEKMLTTVHVLSNEVESCKQTIFTKDDQVIDDKFFSSSFRVLIILVFLDNSSFKPETVNNK
jgi:hypothetical protein